MILSTIAQIKDINSKYSTGFKMGVIKEASERINVLLRLFKLNHAESPPSQVMPVSPSNIFDTPTSNTSQLSAMMPSTSGLTLLNNGSGSNLASDETIIPRPFIVGNNNNINNNINNNNNGNNNYTTNAPSTGEATAVLGMGQQVNNTGGAANNNTDYNLADFEIAFDGAENIYDLLNCF
ncbi:unnamed protein product [Ambrosiozyma monospora]|nr:unnamed protein product [Ambrosiozyma monospora]